MSEYSVDGGVDSFEGSRELFAAMVARLAAPQTDVLTHDELEVLVTEQGRALLRQLFQDQADLPALRERRLPVVSDCDGVAHRRVESGHRRCLATVFGVVTGIGWHIGRRVGRICIPRSRRGTCRQGCIRMLCVGWSRSRPRADHSSPAQAAIERSTGVRVGKRQVEDIAVAAASDIAAFYDARRRDPLDGEDRLLVITADGKGVVMRPDALRAAAAEAAAKPRLASRTSPGEKRGRNVWRSWHASRT